MSEFWEFVREINFKNLKDIDDEQSFNRKFSEMREKIQLKYTKNQLEKFSQLYDQFERQIANKYYEGSFHDQTLDALSFVIAEGDRFYDLLLNIKNNDLAHKIIKILYKRYKYEINFSWLFLKK